MQINIYINKKSTMKYIPTFGEFLNESRLNEAADIRKAPKVSLDNIPEVTDYIFDLHDKWAKFDYNDDAKQPYWDAKYAVEKKLKSLFDKEDFWLGLNTFGRTMSFGFTDTGKEKISIPYHDQVKALAELLGVKLPKRLKVNGEAEGNGVKISWNKSSPPSKVIGVKFDVKNFKKVYSKLKGFKSKKESSFATEPNENWKKIPKDLQDILERTWGPIIKSRINYAGYGSGEFDWDGLSYNAKKLPKGAKDVDNPRTTEWDTHYKGAKYSFNPHKYASKIKFKF